jgi:hypothetical protein
MKRSILLTIVATLSIFCLTANAGIVYSFNHIVEYGDGPIELANGAIGEAQLFVEVSKLSANQVLFAFTNTGPEACSITDIYFDDGALLGIAFIDDSCYGVSFSQYATPHNLPGGNNLSPPFQTTAGFSADSDPPVQPNGINPNEWLGISFDLKSGETYDDVISNLASGELRIGIHVQGFYSGWCGYSDSESFVNNGVVPEPATVTLLSAGFGIVTLLRKRR